MEHSSYEVSEFYVMKTSGKMRILLILMLPFSLSINILSYTFFALFRIFSLIARPKACFREIIKFFPGLLSVIITTTKRAFTGIFEIEAENIKPSEMEKLKNGKPILHPLFGSSFLIEIEVLNRMKGKIIHLRRKPHSDQKAS